MSRFVRSRKLRRRLQRRPWLRRGGQLIEDWLLVGFWRICGWLSPERASRFGAAVLAWSGPCTTKHEKIAANLRVAFPEKSEEERARIQDGIWRNFGAVAGEYPHLGGSARGEAGVGLSLETAVPARLEANFRGERLTVFAAGHLANWEILAAAPRLWDSELAVVYTPLGDGPADRALRAYREQMGSRLLPRDGSARSLWRHLKSGKPVGIVADHRDDEGAELPFFGHTKRTTLSPARLALRAGADFIAVRVERLGPARFKISAVGPLVPPADAITDTEKAIAMMTEFNRLLEGWIRERPEQWLCGKRAFAKALVKGAKPAPRLGDPVGEVPHAQ